MVLRLAWIKNRKLEKSNQSNNICDTLYNYIIEYQQRGVRFDIYAILRKTKDLLLI